MVTCSRISRHVAYLSLCTASGCFVSASTIYRIRSSAPYYLKLWGLTLGDDTTSNLHNRDTCIPNLQPTTTMATDQIGLKVAFYLYPCLLVVTLLGAQTFQFYRERQRVKAGNASKGEPRHDATVIQKRFNRPIWILQLILCLLLITSTVVTVGEAVGKRHDGAGKVDFPFSAYLVQTPFPHSACTSTDGEIRPHMSESRFTF